MMRLLPRLFSLRFFCLAVLASTGLATTGANAQPVRQLSTGFERAVNRFRWTSNAQFALRLAGWDVALTNRFLSDAFILFDDELRFRDEDLLIWQAQRSLGARYTARVRGRTAWFGLSRAFTQEFYGGVRYVLRPFAWVEPSVGVVWDRKGVRERLMAN